MVDLLDDPKPGQNLPEFTVSEISGAVKKTLEDEFGRIRVRGEVGRVFRARSGHLYYDVKDDRNVLACTTWKGQIASLSVEPEEGLEVVVTGRLTSFGAQSKYNLNVDEVAVAGQGALMALLEKRKAALAAEGLFDPARKRPLPYLPQIIGVVTSPSGAVIRDILHRLRDRFPRKVLVWPVAVQGAACAPEVARAIAGFNALTPGGALPRPDLIIVARGGGSVEDLWGFNEEVVARAVVASEIPLISAVGHETDTTLIDFVSDQRAPTPTAAAELAVPVRLDLLSWTEAQGARLTRAAGQAVTQRQQRVRDLSRGLPRPDSLFDGPRQRLDQASERLPNALMRGVQRRQVALAQLAGSMRPAALRQQVVTRAESSARLAARLAPALSRAQAVRQDRLAALSARLKSAAPAAEILRNREAVSAQAARLARAQAALLTANRQRLGSADRMLASLGYQATLERGYAVVHGASQVVTRKSQALKETALDIQFADGRVHVRPDGPPRPKRAPKPVDPDQGTLL